MVERHTIEESKTRAVQNHRGLKNAGGLWHRGCKAAATRVADVNYATYILRILRVIYA